MQVLDLVRVHNNTKSTISKTEGMRWMGHEPEFSHNWMKTGQGGGNLEKNHNIKNFLFNIGYPNKTFHFVLTCPRLSSPTKAPATPRCTPRGHPGT